jgi:hypothetical protein
MLMSMAQIDEAREDFRKARLRDRPDSPASVLPITERRGASSCFEQFGDLQLKSRQIRISGQFL